MKDTTKHANGLDYTDDYHAKHATDAWIEGVAAVPINEVPVMIAEDPAVLSMLVGALRHARANGVHITANSVTNTGVIDVQVNIEAAVRLARQAVNNATLFDGSDPDDEEIMLLARAVLSLHVEARIARDDERSASLAMRDFATRLLDTEAALIEALDGWEEADSCATGGRHDMRIVELRKRVLDA